MPIADENYDERGRWVRQDRPEMLSDRLGYPSERGDQDWLRISAVRDQKNRVEQDDAESGGAR